MPGIIFTRYDHSPTHDDRAAGATTQGPWAASINRRRFIGGISALAAGAAVGVIPGGASLAAQGTPAAADAGGPVDLLRTLLLMVPGSFATGDGGGVLFYHADLAAQFAATGVDRSAADWAHGTNLYAVTASLALVSAGFQYGASPEFAKALGFSPLDVDRALEVGAPPNALSIYQGGLDRATMEAAWAATGFKQVPLDGGQVLWTLGEKGEIDLSSPIAPFGAGAFNNLLLLDDQTLLVARMGEVERAVAAQAGTADRAASMLGVAGVESALAALSPSVTSSIGLNSAGLAPGPRPGAPATPVPAGRMPAISVAVFGIEAGARGEIATDGSTPVAATPGTHGSTALVEVRLVTASAADADAAAKVAASRWETMQSQVTQQPFSDLMTLVASGVSPVENTVAAIDLESGASPGRWIQLVAMQDLGPFAPGGN